MVIRLGRNGRFLACSMYPEHKEIAAAPRAKSRRARRARARSARSAARGRWSASAAGSGRSSAARAIRTATTSRAKARRRPIRCRSRSSARRTATVISWHVVRDGPATSSGAAPTTRSCDFTTNYEPVGGSTTRTTAPSPGKGESGICLVCGATIDLPEGDLVGQRLPGGPPDPGRSRRPARGGRRRSGAGCGVAAGRRTARGAQAARGRGPPAGTRRRRERAARAPARTAATAAIRALRALPPLAGGPRRIAAHPARPTRTAVGALPRLARRARRRLAIAARPDLRGYLARLGDGRTRSTVAQRLAAIRSFHRWAAREGLAAGDPWGAIATPRLPRRLPRVLEVDQVARLLAVSMASSTRRRRRPGPRAAGHGTRPARPRARRDCVCRRAAHQRAGRRGSRGPRPATGRDPRDRQGPQGAHRAARAARASAPSRPTSTTAARSCSSDAAATRRRADSSRREVFLNHRGGPLGVRGLRYRLDRLCRAAGLPEGRLAAHAAPLVRDAPARRRRGPARRPGAARSREPGHDPGLHARVAGAARGRYRDAHPRARRADAARA